MFWSIIKNDWKNLTADRTIWLVAVIFTMLLAYAIYNGSNWTQNKERHYQNLIAEQERKFAENKEGISRGEIKPANAQQIDPTNPYLVGADMIYAVLPSSLLGFTSVGQGDLLRPNIGVSILSKQRTEEDKQGFENPLSFLAGRFDLAFVLVFLLPLLILALSFNLLSSERENGTLQLVLSQPVSLPRFALAKTLTRASSVLFLVFVLTLIGFFLNGINPTNPELREELVLWILAVGNYVLFWFALAHFVNSFGRNSATNAVILAACWIGLVLVVPSLVNVAVTSIYPMPSRTEEINAIRSVNLDLRRDSSRVLDEFYQDHPELAPEADISEKKLTLAYVTIQQELKRRLAEVENKFDAQLARQQETVNTSRFLSPSIVMQEALNDIAGSGVARHRNFRRQTTDFANAWDANFLPLIYRNVKLTAEDYNRIPHFQFQEENSGALFRRVAFGLLFLLAATAVLMFLTFGQLKNYRLEK